MNGAVSRQTSYIYDVVPTRAGLLDIGPITAGAGQANPVHLDVRPAGTGARAPASGPLSSRAAGPPSSSTKSTVLPEPTGRRAFLRVHVPKEELVIGESVPVTVRAYVKAGTAGTITGAPELSSDAFAIHDLVSDPKQGRAEVRGTPYATLTWRGKMTAVLPGEHEVKVSMPATLEWRDLVRTEEQRPFGGDRFGSLFDRLANDPAFGGMPSPLSTMFSGSSFGGFGSFFSTGFGASHSANVTLEGDVGTVRVTEPPEEGRPEGYDGAVGHFEISADVSPGEVHVGEPITLSLHVRGEGTFDRVHHDLVADGSSDFRVYPVTSSMAGDSEKVFEQNLVPIHDGTLEVGALSLSYYDAETATYQTVTTSPLSVQVLPSSDEATVSESLSASAEDGFGPTPPRIASAPGAYVSSLSALPRSPWPFGAALLIMGLSLGGALAFRRRDEGASSRRSLARHHRRGYRKAKRQMRATVKSGDAHGFFLAARAAIQQRYGAKLGVEPASVTLTELEERLDDLPVVVAMALGHADAVSFGDAQLDHENLHDWYDHLTKTLEEETDA